MTESQLMKAACHVCQMRGLNAHLIVADGHEACEQWVIVAREVQAQAQVIAALRCAGVSP